MRRALAETEMASKSAGIKAVATKVKAAPQKEGEAPEKDAPETPDAPLALLDLSERVARDAFRRVVAAQEVERRRLARE